MNTIYTYSLALLVCVNLYSCQTLEQKRARAQEIINIHNMTPAQLEETFAQFSDENQNTCSWFEQHASKLSDSLLTVVPDAEVKMMGSRRWDTTHLLSDIDAVVVTQVSDHEKVVDALQDWYVAQYPEVKQFRTKTRAGLSLFILKAFTDPKLGEMKLEYTVQSPETNRAIINGMTARLATRFTSPTEKNHYAVAMMKAVYDDNIQEQLALKEWTRVLPGN